MASPKVSIIWLNYNSSKTINIVLKSLESIANTEYPQDRYELIVVDNGSNDGSFEKIKDFLEKNVGFKRKVIKLEHNLGFTGGNNIGFKARDKDSKYVLLLNNDAVLFQDGLKTLVEHAENYTDVAGLQGVVLKYGTSFIDIAGGFIDELLGSYGLGSGYEYPWILSKPLQITYADGSCALYKVESLMKCLGNKLFIDEFFGYYDDTVLGLMMWNCGYESIMIPEPVASHARGLTFGKKRGSTSHYLGVRNRIALSLITNSRYRRLILLFAFRNSAYTIIKMGFKREAHIEARGIYDGFKLGKRLREKEFFIDLHKALLIEIPFERIPSFFTTRGYSRKYFEEWVIRNISNLSIE